MCGRTSLFLPPSLLESRFDADLAEDAVYRPRYNIAPGADLEVVTNESPEAIQQYHWGLVPFWADEPDEGLINARAETAAEKRPFEDAWASRPCLVLSTGFYEWRAPNGGPKTPYRIYRDRDGADAAFAMAGLWETWEGDDREIPSVTILTTEPNELVEPIHDRMPVVLRAEEEETWMEAGPDERHELCRPYPGDDLDAYEISTHVNNPGNDDASVMEPAETEQSGLGEF